MESHISLVGPIETIEELRQLLFDVPGDELCGKLGDEID